MPSYSLLKSRFSAFFDWWLSGLLSLLPEKTRERIRPTPDEVSIGFDKQFITFKHYNIRKQLLVEKRSIEQNDELEKANIVKWLIALQTGNVQFVLELPEQKVLKKTLLLPVSAESNLDEILGFEMDRQTPFTLDKVYFDHEIVKRDPDNEKLHIELFVVLKNHLESLLEQIHAFKIEAHRASPTNNKHVNLLPKELRPKSSNQFGMLNLSILCITVFLFFTMLYLPLIQQEQVLSELETELNQARIQAKQTQTLITEKESILSRTQFLNEKRNNQTPIIELLKELTHILPDNTWLNRLIVRKDEIQLHGESDIATSIIQTIENSTFFENAQFRSPVTKNNSTQKDKFHVSARVLKLVSNNNDAAE